MDILSLTNSFMIHDISKPGKVLYYVEARFLWWRILRIGSLRIVSYALLGKRY